MDDMRIPIEDFVNYTTCRIVGHGVSIRWDACMNAMEASRIERKNANRELAQSAAQPDWRDIYVVA